jgi:hypothetical protein
MQGMYLVSAHEFNDWRRRLLTDKREDRELFWTAYLENNWAIFMQTNGLECRMHIPKVTTCKLTLEENTNERYIAEFSMDYGPPITVDDKVNFNTSIMRVDMWYPFSYRNEKYLAVKTSEKTVEIYKVKK